MEKIIDEILVEDHPIDIHKDRPCFGCVFYTPSAKNKCCTTDSSCVQPTPIVIWKRVKEQSKTK